VQVWAHAKSDDPFEILEKIHPNAYKVDLSYEYGIFATFDVDDLSPYYDEIDELLSLRSNSNQARGYERDYPLEPIETH